MRTAIAVCLGLVLVIGLAGCGDDIEEIPTTPDETPEGPDAPPPSTGSGKLVWTTPSGWKSVSPKTDMVHAQFSIPGAGDEGPVDFKIYWQPTGMGDVAMNLGRWIGMMRKADGKPCTREDAAIDTREINGLKVTTLDISGTYGGGMMGGAHAGSTTSDARLLAAIVEVPGGVPYYLKVVGPAATMKAAMLDYEKFLTSLRAE